MEMEMRKNPVTTGSPAAQVVKDIRRATRKLQSSEEKIRIMLSGLQGEDSIAALCRQEGSAQSLPDSWSKEDLEAGKKRLAGDTTRHARTGEVKDLRTEAVWKLGAIVALVDLAPAKRAETHSARRESAVISNFQLDWPGDRSFHTASGRSRRSRCFVAKGGLLSFASVRIEGRSERGGPSRASGSKSTGCTHLRNKR
jgi:transposase